MLDAALWALAVGLTVAIAWSSLGPAPAPLEAFRLSDKLLHFAAYAATTGAYLLAAVWRPGRGAGPYSPAAGLIVAMAIALAAAMEFAQGAFTSRTADAFDAVAGSIGALAALGVWAAARVRVERPVR